MTWRDWFQQNIDKGVLVALYLGLLFFVWQLLHTAGASPENIAWAREAAGTVLGAILGLITGVSIAHRNPPPGSTTETTVKQVTETPAEPKP